MHTEYGRQEPPDGFYARRPRYKIFWHNIEVNQWQEVATARTLDEAFDEACALVGASKIHDVISIEDPAGVEIWNSDGYATGEGARLPSANKINWHVDNDSEGGDVDNCPDGPPNVADDGSC